MDALGLKNCEIPCGFEIIRDRLMSRDEMESRRCGDVDRVLEGDRITKLERFLCACGNISSASSFFKSSLALNREIIAGQFK